MGHYMKDSHLINGFDKIVAQEPFFSFVITFSGHGPYTEEMGTISEPHLQRAIDAANSKGITGEDKTRLNTIMP